MLDCSSRSEKSEGFVVSIKIKLDRDGNVIFSKLINDNKLSESFFRAAAESALRAVNHPECKKLKVPEKKYKTWKEIILTLILHKA